MSVEKIDLNITGMTCVNCSNGIEKSLKRKKGVISAKASFASNDGSFEIDNELFSKDDLITNIEKLGYGVEEDTKKLEEKQLKEFNILKFEFIVSLVLTISIFILSFSNIVEDTTKQFTVLALAVVIQFYCGKRFYIHAYSALINKNYDMNVLVALGTSAAFFYSLFVIIAPNLFPENLRFVYFDGAAVIITFLLLGKYLEENSKQKASDYLKKLMDLAPLNANLMKNDGIEKVLASTLQIGDKVIVKVGEKIPADGFIIEGESDIDTSMITGESMPQFKKVGDEVLSGTLNTNAILTIEISKKANDTTLSKIIKLLKTAQSKNIPISRFADKVANIFVPLVIIVSILTFLVWGIFIGDYQKAIISSISVLIISCPCALGLATPIAIVSSVSRGAKEGILIKNPEVLEEIKNIKYAVFDKTGTITKGEIEVSNINIDEKYFNLLGSIEILSEHPISKAIVNYVQSKDIKCDLKIDDIEIIPGHGIKAIFENKEVLIGNEKLLKDNQVNIKESIDAIFVSINKELIGSITLEDALKEYSKEMISELKAMNITPVLLTGDNSIKANDVAKRIGIEKVYSQVIPTQKYEVIKELQKDAKVMFVGDGINDAPSIKQANIGITLNSGSDISKDAGDIILVNNELKAITKSIILSIETMKIVKQNLFWAFAYNTVGIPIAAGVLYPSFGIMLSPMYAGIAMSFSSVSVVINSLRLKIKSL